MGSSTCPCGGRGSDLWPDKLAQPRSYANGGTQTTVPELRTRHAVAVAQKDTHSPARSPNARHRFGAIPVGSTRSCFFIPILTSVHHVSAGHRVARA
eukprot:1926394-Rhodomonas_salina.5